jgi:hypothetical protein
MRQSFYHQKLINSICRARWFAYPEQTVVEHTPPRSFPTIGPNLVPRDPVHPHKVIRWGFTCTPWCGTRGNEHLP